MMTNLKRLIASAVASSALVAGAGAGSAQSLAPQAASPAVAVTPQAYLQLATPSGSGPALDLFRIPVVTSTGAVVYKDVRLRFDVSASGALTLTAGYPLVSASAVALTDSFLMAKYSLSGVFYDLSGPGVAAAGRTTWSLNLKSTSTGCLISAGWTTGPVAGHPFQNRLTAAKITYGGYAYGALGSVNCGGDGVPQGWASGNLIGAAATANGFTLFRYTNASGVDQSSPVDSLSLQKCPATGSC